MHPRLLEIPVIHVTVWGFGLMMALGFLVALWLVRGLSRRAGLDPETMSNVTLYALLVGVIGARTFFVLHHVHEFRGEWLGVFAIWRGGLEFLGGVVPALGFLLIYLRLRKLPVRKYLDILAVGLMMGLAFGRIGCFLNGCCYGRPTELPWGLRFPYRSYAYVSQTNPDPKRNRAEPYLDVPPAEYAQFYAADGMWYPKPLETLSDRQRYEVTKGQYRCLPVHPTQLYASVHALALCGMLYLLWRRSLVETKSGRYRDRLRRPGIVVAGLCLFYGPGRFVLEALRDDNPYELGTLTISQIMGLAMLAGGVVLLGVLLKRGDNVGATQPSPTSGRATAGEPGMG